MNQEQENKVDENGECIRLSIELTRSTLEKVDQLKDEWGLRGRGAIIERLLEECFEGYPSQKSEKIKTL
jgi:metal-responsive CopG/Arc/MetJ family transcriptional regulator